MKLFKFQIKKREIKRLGLGREKRKKENWI